MQRMWGFIWHVLYPRSYKQSSSLNIRHLKNTNYLGPEGKQGRFSLDSGIYFSELLEIWRIPQTEMSKSINRRAFIHFKNTVYTTIIKTNLAQYNLQTPIAQSGNSRPPVTDPP